MSKLYILISLNNYIYISPQEAIRLEIELNLSSFSKKWKNLGNILFNWRINTEYYVNNQPSYYLISEQQFNWIHNFLSKIKYPLNQSLTD